MIWRDQQLLFNIDSSSIEVSIDLVDIIDNEEIQETLASQEIDLEEKTAMLTNSAKEIVKDMVDDKVLELQQWASHNNMKIKIAPMNEITVDIDWKEIILDLGI
jgi:hypothetical protein